MDKYITHFVAEKLPIDGFRQLSFLTATKDSYKKGIFFYGYNGARSLTELQLQDEIYSGRIVRLIEPLNVKDRKYLWSDRLGNLWISDDESFTLNKKKIQGSNKVVSIFNQNFKGKLSKPKRELAIPNI